ncbi:MerR family transcriptional regulator [Parasphingorhabdus halotolerans]|uniref:MerR family transcriptional regulator n=1 Tax=Parasphingorhabdus halotolerans TaxID=2725558 RepID=A0A6H2DNQ6_9SPHN|nr:MerR family transcriptional regulator [Parasphingorhabdus halotolerans]QJB70020.1 MerR family transcriptional regulator [Parasphingorhabdus halotolerans]
MMKDSGAFRTIGELSKELKIKPHILRYWEDQFAMLQPLKRAGSRRHYRPEDVEMVKTINRLLHEEGYTIKGARKFLTSRKNQPTTIAEAPAMATSTASALPMTGPGTEDNSLIVKELKSIRDRLSSALNEA